MKKNKAFLELIDKLIAVEKGEVLQLFHDNGEYQARLLSFTATDKKKRTLDIKLKIFTMMQNMDYADDEIIVNGEDFSLELTVLKQRRKKADGGYYHTLDAYGEM
ncbi:MAG: hypothetical protein WC052_06155 [Patescibacteria group bacterium]